MYPRLLGQYLVHSIHSIDILRWLLNELNEYTCIQPSPVHIHTYTHSLSHSLTFTHTHKCIKFTTWEEIPVRRTQLSELHHQPASGEVTSASWTPLLVHSLFPRAANELFAQPQNSPPPSFLSSVKTKNCSKRFFLKEKKRKIKSRNYKLLRGWVDRAGFLSSATPWCLAADWLTVQGPAHRGSASSSDAQSEGEGG